MWGAIAKGIGGAIVGEVAVGLALNTTGFDKGVSSSVKNTEKAYKNAFNGIGNAGTAMFSKLARAAATFVSLGAIVKFSKEALKLGSDLQEVQNVVDVTFGSMSKSVNEYAQNAITTAGLSETVAKKYMGTFGAMNNQFGFTTKESYEMSKAITQLTGDVASFYNLSSDEAYTKLKSIWTGETETLKEIGVVMTQNALDQYALANGYGKTTAKMTEQEKVALRYAFVQDKLKLASGDFVRTQDSWANSTRVLTLRWQQFMATIGQGLINVLTPLVRMLNVLMEKLQAFANTFKKFTASVFGDANSGSGGIASTTTNISDGLSGIGSSASDSAKKVSDASKEMKKSLAGVDELNVINNTKDTGTGTDGISGIGSSGIDTNGISNEMETSVEKVTKSAFEWGESIGNAINKALEKIPWDSIQEKVNSAMSTFANFLNGAIKEIDWHLMGSTIGEGFNTIVGGIKTFFTKFDWGEAGFSFGTTISGFFETVDWKQLGGTISDGLRGVLRWIIEAIKGINWFEIGRSVVDFLVGIDWIGLLSDLGSVLWNALLGVGEFLLGVVFGIGENIVKGIWDGITSFLEDPKQWLKEHLVEPIIQGVKDLFGIHSPSTVFAEIGGFLIDGLSSGFGDLKEWAKGKFEDIISGFSGIYEKGKEIGTNIINGIKTGAGNIKNWASEKLENIKSGFSNAKTALTNTGQNIKDGLTSGMGSLKTWASGKLTDIKNGFADAWTKGKEIGGNIWSGLKNAFSSKKLGLNVSYDTNVGTVKTAVYKALGLSGWPKLSFLAQGGWVAANNPQLAVIGDNKREGEIVAPESKIREQVKQAISEMGGAGKQELSLTLYVKYEDGKTIIKKVNQAQIDAGEVLLIT